MLIGRLSMILFAALGMTGPADAQEPPATGGGQLGEPAAVYAQNKPQKKDAKTPKSRAGSGKSVRKSRGPASPKMTREEEIKKLYRRVADLVEAKEAAQMGTAVAICRETLPLLGADIDKDFALALSMSCAWVYGENALYGDEMAIYDALEKGDVAIDVHTGICLARSTALTKQLRYEEARQVLQNCPSNACCSAMIDGNLAELHMTMGDLDKAIGAYREAIEKSPKNEHALYGLATALARDGQWKAAHAQFLRGVARDPGFNFLKSAFFVPKAENDFQKAFLKLALGRYDEAEFYLRRYVASEERLPYKAVGACALDNLRKIDKSGRAQYPVLLQKVRAAAIDASARYLVFADVDLVAQKSAHSDLWILDTQTGRTTKAISLDDVFLVDAQFIGATTQLRVLGAMQRYELDAAAPEKGYYVFENTSRNLPVALSPSAGDILSISSSNKINMAPWNFDGNTAVLATAPDDTMRVALLNDHNVIAFSGMSGTTIFRLTPKTDDGSQNDEERAPDAVFPMQFDVRKMTVHPQKPVFALGIQSGTLLVDENATILSIIGAPVENAGADLVAIDPTGKWMLTVSENTAEIVAVDDVRNPVMTQWTCRTDTPIAVAARK